MALRSAISAVADSASTATGSGRGFGRPPRHARTHAPSTQNCSAASVIPLGTCPPPVGARRHRIAHLGGSQAPGACPSPLPAVGFPPGALPDPRLESAYRRRHDGTGHGRDHDAGSGGAPPPVAHDGAARAPRRLGPRRRARLRAGRSADVHRVRAARARLGCAGCDRHLGRRPAPRAHRRAARRRDHMGRRCEHRPGGGRRPQLRRGGVGPHGPASGAARPHRDRRPHRRPRRPRRARAHRGVRRRHRLRRGRRAPDRRPHRRRGLAVRHGLRRTQRAAPAPPGGRCRPLGRGRRRERHPGLRHAHVSHAGWRPPVPRRRRRS